MFLINFTIEIFASGWLSQMSTGGMINPGFPSESILISLGCNKYIWATILFSKFLMHTFLSSSLSNSNAY